MIRDITRQQIDIKTGQGERVVLIEAQSDRNGYESRHLPGAMAIPVEKVRHLATQYLPDSGAEIVVYGTDERSSEVDDVAWQLSLLGYNNIYVYRGGKRDWFGAGEYMESMHQPPPIGSHVNFVNAVRRRGGRAPNSTAILRYALFAVGLYGVVAVLRASRGKRERMHGTDEVSDFDFERNASAFDSASGAE